MDEIQFWRVAAELMTLHGDGAEVEALKRADAALDGGDVDGFNRWKRIARIITEMQNKTSGDGEVH
jgi:hypothetical protein